MSFTPDTRHEQSAVDPPGGDVDVVRFWERATELFAVVGPDGRFERINPAWTRVLGWREDEVVGRLPTEFIHTADLEATRNATVVETDEGRMLPEMENRYRHRDGSVRWLRWSGYELDGRWYGIARDVTATHTSHDALRASEQRSRAIVAALREGLLVVEADGHIRECNDRFAEMVGLRVDEVVGLRAPFPWWSEGADLAAVHAAGVGGQAVTAETTFVHRAGQRFRVLIDGVPLARRDGAAATLAVVRDVSELVAARDRLIDIHMFARLTSWDWIAASDRAIVYLDGVGGEETSWQEYDAEEMMQPIAEEHREPLRRARIAVASGDRDDFALDVRLNTEPPVWVELRGSPLLDDAGARIGVRGSAQDVTDRRAHLDRARRVGSLLDGLAMPVVGADADLRITDVNAAAAARLGAPVDALVGEPLEPRLGPHAASLRDETGAVRPGCHEIGPAEPRLSVVVMHPEAG